MPAFPFRAAVLPAALRVLLSPAAASALEAPTETSPPAIRPPLVALPEWIAAPIRQMDAETAALAGWGLGAVAGLVLGAIGGGLVVSLLRDRAERRLGDRFEALSSAALDRNSDRLLALAGERFGAWSGANDAALERREAAVDALVRPLRESLAQVDEKLQRVETEREGHYRALTKHLELVATGQRDLAEETQGLRRSLGAPNARGRWGELQLRRVVELAGMLEHCDFEEQVTLQGGSGERARPDLVVHLPGGRQIVIDAKAPLDAYLAASETDDPTERRRHLIAHARAVRRHVDDLGGRDYSGRIAGNTGAAKQAGTIGKGETLEFVVLFLPGEPFFSAALENDPTLIERGVDKRVLLAGPTTLIALLRAVAYGWQQETMAENAVVVSRLGRELYDRILGLNERFANLGRKLDGAVQAYDATIGTLESRVHVSARRMAELGIAPERPLDPPAPLGKRTRVPSGLRAAPSDAPPENEGAAASGNAPAV